MYQMKKLIHCFIGTMFAVPLCCDCIIPHQYWQLCDESKNVFGIFDFFICSNKQFFADLQNLFLNVISAVTWRADNIRPYRIVQTVAILRSGNIVFLTTNYLNELGTAVRRAGG